MTRLDELNETYLMPTDRQLRWSNIQCKANLDFHYHSPSNRLKMVECDYVGDDDCQICFVH